MKTIFSLLLTVLLFSGCSIYEEVYFNEDMSVKYQMKFDASEMVGMLSASSLPGYNKHLPTDSVISLAEIMAEHKDSIKSLSIEEQNMLNDLRPLNVRINSDSVAKTLFISLFGDFTSADALNKTFRSLAESKDKVSMRETNIRTMNQMDNASRYSWDGKMMKREIDPEMLSKSEVETNKDKKGLADMFMGGKMVVKYHFPKRVINVSNPNALLSQDGKTVVIEYPATDFIDSTEKINIEITTE